MSASPSKLARFWQELKRRRVIHVITVYASAAFVIIELVGNLTEPLNLPPNLATIVIIVLAVGFPLAVVLSWLYDLTGEGIEKTKALSEIPEEEEKSKVPNAWKIATIVSFIVIIGLVTINIVIGTRGLRPGEIKSLAILPFNNLTGDDQLDWAAAAMHDIINRDMGKVRALRIFSTTTSIAFREAGMTAAEIDEKYNVDVLVEPTLISYGDMVLIQLNAFLTYPEEKQLFFLEYHEPKNQIMNLSSRIAIKIAHELKINLSQQEETLLAESRAIDTAAIDAYLRSHQYWDDFNEDSLNKALEYLNIAVEKDPEWAPLYAGLVNVWAGLAQFGHVSADIARPKIHENIYKALEFDPDHPDVIFANGLAAAWDWDWEKCEKARLKALAINPNDAISRIYYAHLLMSLQRSDEALAQGQRAVELDPLNPLIQALYAVVLMDAGKYQSAKQHIDKALSIDPNHWFALRHQIFLYETTGDYQRWFELWKQNPELPYLDLLTIEKVFHEKGYLAANEEIIKRIVEAAKQNEEAAEKMHIPIAGLAEKYLIVKKYDKALDWLEVGVENRVPGMFYISTSTYWDHLKDNPRYIELLKKMNLPLPQDQ